MSLAIPPVDPARTLGISRQLLTRLERRIGRLPTGVLVVANSSNALRGYLSLFGALRSAGLPARLSEAIALLVNEMNQCEYGLAEHARQATAVGVTAADILANRRGRSSTPRFQAALAFTQTLLATRGHVDDEELRRLRDAGFSTGQIVEIIAHAALNLFASYLANAARLPAEPASPGAAHGDTLLAS